MLAGALLIGGGATLFEQTALAKDKTAPVRLNVDETPVKPAGKSSALA